MQALGCEEFYHTIDQHDWFVIPLCQGAQASVSINGDPYPYYDTMLLGSERDDDVQMDL